MRRVMRATSRLGEIALHSAKTQHHGTACGVSPVHFFFKENWVPLYHHFDEPATLGQMHLGGNQLMNFYKAHIHRSIEQTQKHFVDGTPISPLAM